VLRLPYQSVKTTSKIIIPSGDTGVQLCTPRRVRYKNRAAIRELMPKPKDIQFYLVDEYILLLLYLFYDECANLDL